MSLKKIAELAGTSVATVSRVLNNPNYRCRQPGLQEKIWEIAKDQGHLPNLSARNLRLGTEHTPTLTVDIFLTRFDSMDQDPFFREIFQHIREELLKQGCLLGQILCAADIMTLGSEPSQMEKVPYKSTEKLLWEKQSNPLSLIPPKENTGLIILGKCPENLIPVLKKRYSCITGIDRNPTDHEYDEVTCNGAAAAETAVEYLISLGHRDIAYIGNCTYESRYIGYYQSLLNHKIPLNHGYVLPTNHTMEEGFAKMNAILDNPQRPTAIFCANDSTALGVLQALKKTKKRGYLPSVISIDNIQEAEKSSPMLTTIDIPKKEMGHLAVNLLLDRYQGNHQEHIRMEFPFRLIVRESCNYR